MSNTKLLKDLRSINQIFKKTRKFMFIKNPQGITVLYDPPKDMAKLDEDYMNVRCALQSKELLNSQIVKDGCYEMSLEDSERLYQAINKCKLDEVKFFTTDYGFMVQRQIEGMQEFHFNAIAIPPGDSKFNELFHVLNGYSRSLIYVNPDDLKQIAKELNKINTALSIDVHKNPPVVEIHLSSLITEIPKNRHVFKFGNVFKIDGRIAFQYDSTTNHFIILTEAKGYKMAQMFRIVPVIT